MARGIFRSGADPASPPADRLDAVVPATDAQSWLGLAGLGLLLAAGLAWSYLGSLPTRITGEGILLAQGGRMTEAVAATGGVVAEIAVEVDQIVEAGDVIAVLARPEMVAELDSAVAELWEMRTAFDRASAETAQETELRLDELDREIAALEARIAEAEAAAADLGRPDRSSAGLTPAPITGPSGPALPADDTAIDGLRQDLARLQATRFEVETAARQGLAAAESRVNAARQAVAEVRRRLERGARILAPVSGQVVALRASAGTVLAVGDPVVSLESFGDGLELSVFLPPQEGKAVAPGMAALVSPEIVPAETHGMVRARVERVSELPSTPEGMMALLRSRALVEQFSRSGPPYRAVLSLEPDGDSASGYGWTTEAGGAIDLASGTLATVEITLSRQRPIAVLIPSLADRAPR